MGLIIMIIVIVCIVRCIALRRENKSENESESKEDKEKKKDREKNAQDKYAPVISMENIQTIPSNTKETDPKAPTFETLPLTAVGASERKEH